MCLFSALSLTAFAPLVLSQAITLVGPVQIFSCQQVWFNWTGGRPPYQFQPVVWQAWPNTDALETVVTSLTNVRTQVNLEPGYIAEFTAEDVDNTFSNKMAFQVQGGSDCSNPSSNPRHGPWMVTLDTVTAVDEFIWMPWTKTTTPNSSPATSPPSSSEVSLNTNTHLPIGIIILIAFLSTLPIALCILLWYCRRKILQRSKVANGIAQRWEERKSRKGFEKTMKDGINSDSRFLEANPFATPFSSSTALPSSSGVLPSSKERRERQWEFRQSVNTASMTDTLGPVSTIPSTSIWPERSDDGITEEDQYMTGAMRRESTPTSIPSTEDSRTYHALTSPELTQTPQSPPQSSSSHTSGTLQNSPKEPSPFFRAWTKEAQGN